MFYLIDKPIGMSSFDVIRQLRTITGIRKMGHSGTLDPLASGCLLIGTESSTKMITYLENNKKRYTFTVDVSLSSPSLDLWTPPSRIPYNHIRLIESDEIVDFLSIQTKQVPPQYSALHVDGKRAYELARSWVNVSLSERAITITDIIIEQIDLPTITITLTISSGGYIRSLAPILADFLWVPWGGIVTSLRRIQLWNLFINQSQSLDTFDYNNPLPYSTVFPNIDSIRVSKKYIPDIQNGKIISPHQEYEMGKKYFLLCDTIRSLVIGENIGLRIIKNFV